MAALWRDITPLYGRAARPDGRRRRPLAAPILPTDGVIRGWQREAAAVAMGLGGGGGGGGGVRRRGLERGRRGWSRAAGLLPTQLPSCPQLGCQARPGAADPHKKVHSGVRARPTHPFRLRAAVPGPPLSPVGGPAHMRRRVQCHDGDGAGLGGVRRAARFPHPLDGIRAVHGGRWRGGGGGRGRDGTRPRCHGSRCRGCW